LLSLVSLGRAKVRGDRLRLRLNDALREVRVYRSVACPCTFPRYCQAELFAQSFTPIFEVSILT